MLRCSGRPDVRHRGGGDARAGHRGVDQRHEHRRCHAAAALPFPRPTAWSRHPRESRSHRAFRIRPQRSSASRRVGRGGHPAHAIGCAARGARRSSRCRSRTWVSQPYTLAWADGARVINGVNVSPDFFTVFRAARPRAGLHRSGRTRRHAAGLHPHHHRRAAAVQRAVRRHRQDRVICRGSGDGRRCDGRGVLVPDAPRHQDGPE